MCLIVYIETIPSKVAGFVGSAINIDPTTKSTRASTKITEPKRDEDLFCDYRDLYPWLRQCIRDSCGESTYYGKHSEAC